MNHSFLRWLCAGLAATLLVFLVEPGLALAAETAVAGDVTTHTFKNTKAVAFLFWFFAAATLGGSIFVITRRNMVTAVKTWLVDKLNAVWEGVKAKIRAVRPRLTERSGRLALFRPTADG